MKSVHFLFAAVAVVTSLSTGHANDVPTSQTNVTTVRTFKNLRIRLPVLIDNAGDGSGRLFVASQVGKIFVMDENDKDVSEPAVFLDIEDKVRYIDRENEEGLWDWPFTPNTRRTGTSMCTTPSIKKVAASLELLSCQDLLGPRTTRTRSIRLPKNRS